MPGHLYRFFIPQLHKKADPKDRVALVSTTMVLIDYLLLICAFVLCLLKEDPQLYHLTLNTIQSSD